MRSPDQTMLQELLQPEDRAIEAVVARYQRVAPAITRFARTLSGNEELRVRLGSEASSSNDEIVCDPRVFQAAYNRNAPVTPSEVALASALHEAVHLVSTNLDERRTIPADWIRVGSAPENGSDPAKAMSGPVDFDTDDEGADHEDSEFEDSDFDDTDYEDDDASPPVDATDEEQDEPVDLLSALERAGGPVTEIIFFTMEDARQERQGLAAYPGAHSVLSDLYRAALPTALVRAGGLSQYLTACFLITAGHMNRETLERRLDGRAAAAVNDATDLLEEAAVTKDPWAIGGIALHLEQIAALHGLLTLVPAGATSNQREMTQEADAESAASGVNQVRLASPVIDDADSYQDVRRAAQARSGASDKKGTSEVADDESTDQLLRVSQAPQVFLPTGQRSPLVVSPMPRRFADFATEGRVAMAAAARRWDVAQRHVSGELFPLFAANQRRGLRSGYDQGDVSPHAALLIGAGLYQRLYERRAARTRRTYAVSLLVDASASMLMSRQGAGQRRGMPSPRPWGMSAALLGAWTLASLADELQIDFELALFNKGFAARVDDTEWSYSRSQSGAIAGLRQTQGTAADRLTSTTNHYLVKPFDRRWREAEDVLAGLFWTSAEPRAAATLARREPRTTAPVSMFEKAANVDEFNVIHAAERMSRFGAHVRVLVVLADGMTRGSVENLTSAVSSLEDSGTTVLGIGIGDDTVTRAYSRSEVVEQPDDLARAMIEGVRSALRRSLAVSGMDSWWVRSSNQLRKEAS